MADGEKDDVDDNNDENSKLSVLGCFFGEVMRTKDEWVMKCSLCSTKIKSKPGVTSNFHRHLRVSVDNLAVLLCWHSIIPLLSLIA